MPNARREYPPSVSYLIATLMAVSQLCYQGTIPFKLKALGGGLDSVGFLFTWTSAWYIAAGFSLGWISHRYGPRRTMLTALVICAGMVVLVPLAAHLWQVYMIATAYLVTMCVFWSALEHATAGLHTNLSLMKSTAFFGTAFSIGNSVGQMTSSVLVATTLTAPFLLAAGVLVVVFGLTWLTVSPEAGFRHSTPEDIAAFPDSSRQRAQRALFISRLGISASYGMYALATLFLPRYLSEQRHFNETQAGALTTVILLAMAVTFAAHGRWTSWPHRMWIVRSCPFLAGGCVLIVGLAHSAWAIAGGGILIGVIAATAYSHNLYYSLEVPGTRARNAGIHEALIGLAFLLPPLMAGLAARFTQMPESIFWAGAGLSLAVGIVQNVAAIRTK